MPASPTIIAPPDIASRMAGQPIPSLILRQRLILNYEGKS
jgi:hypothetical protein